MRWDLKHIGILWVINFITCFSMAQEGNMQGVIIDHNGIPISGATIFILEANKGTVSDMDGRFTLVNIPAGHFQVQVRYLGYSDQEEQIQITDSETLFLTVMLVPQSILLRGVELVSRITAIHARGKHLFGAPHHDAAQMEDAFGPVPLAGFFCNGEIGSVGSKAYLHGFTASGVAFVEA
jgi:hypothetical protein